MYRLLIVDDEVEVVEYFYRIFKYKSNLELEIYVAYSAMEALECLDKTRIDIILSDIKMPKINGLQMYEEVRLKWPKSKFIFLSGVIDFEYVYKSIQKKGVRYLTKLEPTDKIIQTVKEVIAEIEESFREKNAMDKIKKQIQKAYPLLQNRYFENLLLTIRDDPSIIQDQFNELHVPLMVDKPFILIGGIFDEIREDMGTVELDKNLYLLQQIAVKYFSPHYYSACYISEQKYFIWFVQLKENIKESNKYLPILNGVLEYIQKGVRENLDLTLTFVYENKLIPLQEIPKHYRSIKRSLGYKSNLLKESIVALSDYQDYKTILLRDDESVLEARFLLSRMNELEGYLELGQKKSFFDLITQLLEPLNNVRSFNYNPALEIYYRICCMFLKYINEWNMTEILAFKIDIRKLTRADDHECWQDAIDYFKKLAQLIFEIHFKNEDIWSDNTIAILQKYILEHLHEDLSLIVLGDIVNLNPSYLSRLFKSVTQMNLYDYILDMRMLKAKDLLLKTGDKIQNIAMAVGYESAPSFTRAFRKYTGKSPSEFRDSIA